MVAFSHNIFAGIDIGAVFTKVVLVSDGKPVASEMVASGMNYRESAKKVMDRVISKAAVSPEKIERVVTTGIGALNAPFDSRQVSDILCQAKGIACLFPSAAWSSCPKK